MSRWVAKLRVEGSYFPRLALAMAKGMRPRFLMMIYQIHWKLKIQTYENDNSFNINFSSTCNGITHFLSSMDLVWSIGTNAMVGSTWIWLVNFLSAFPPNGNLPRYKSSSRSSCGEETTTVYPELIIISASGSIFRCNWRCLKNNNSYLCHIVHGYLDILNSRTLFKIVEEVGQRRQLRRAEILPPSKSPSRK